MTGRIAYCPQDAWIFSGTLRQNVVFGMKFNEKKYNEVIKGELEWRILHYVLYKLRTKA